jgi:hypothetical protein
MADLGDIGEALDDAVRDDEPAEIPLEPSMYGDIILTMEKGDVPQKISSCALLVLLTIFQLVLIVDVGPVFAKNGLSEKVNASWGGSEFKHWAYDGDGALPIQTGQTKPSRFETCQGSDWSWHETQMGDHGEYHAQSKLTKWFLPAGSRLSLGRQFGIIALLLWIVLLFKEFRFICQYLTIAFTLGEDPDDEPGYKYRYEEGKSAKKGFEKKWYLDSIGTCTRITIIVVGLWRFVFLILLGKIGCEFLAHTESVKDFILNSLALGFVYDLDELFFTTALSYKKVKRVTQCQPITVQMEGLEYVQGNVEYVMLLLGFGCLLCADITLLQPYVKMVVCNSFATVCNGSGQVEDWVPEFCKEGLLYGGNSSFIGVENMEAPFIAS